MTRSPSTTASTTPSKTTRHAPGRAARIVALAIALSAVAVSLTAHTASAVTTDSAVTASTGSDTVSVLMRFEGDPSQADITSALTRAGVTTADLTLHSNGLAEIDVIAPRYATATALQLSAIDGVKWAVPDGVVTIQSAGVPPNDPYYTSPSLAQRQYLGPTSSFPHSVNLEPAWERAFAPGPYSVDPARGSLTIAVIDTGYRQLLREDTGRIVPVYDYVNSDSDPTDDHLGAGTPFHGTRVTSVILAQADNAFGIAGAVHAAPVRALIYKAFDSQGNGRTSWVIQSMMDAADRGARVINISAGENSTAAALAAYSDAVSYCSARGAVVVAAVGNDPARGVLLPAAAPGALAVGSIDPVTGVVSGFSARGPQVDVVAPGQNIRSVMPGSTAFSEVFNLSSGTSFSAPLVSGTVALLNSVLPGAATTAVRDAILATAVDLGPVGRDSSYGLGRVDADAAYARLISQTPSLGQVSVSAASPTGFETTLQWNAPSPSGSGLVYRYGYVGGPSYLTTRTSARLALPEPGPHTVYVQPISTNRWSSAETTTSVVVTADMARLGSTRLEGPDRYQTAVATSAFHKPEGAPVVVVASGENWPDALAAAPLAAAANGVVLLTRASVLPASTRDELLRLDPSSIVIIGGRAAISSDVEGAIRALLPSADVARVAGQNRYETSREVAARLMAHLGAIPDNRAIIASGRTYPDALSASALAASALYPILLTEPGTLPQATRSALTSLGISQTLVVGGPNAITSSVLTELPFPVRRWGTDRYETSREIAEWGYATGNLSSGVIGFATGSSFPDALSAGPVMGAARGSTILIDGGDPLASAWLAERGVDVSDVKLFGGPAALPYATEMDIKASLRPAE